MARKAPTNLFAPTMLDRQVECESVRMPEGLAI